MSKFHCIVLAMSIEEAWFPKNLWLGVLKLLKSWENIGAVNIWGWEKKPAWFPEILLFISLRACSVSICFDCNQSTELFMASSVFVSMSSLELALSFACLWCLLSFFELFLLRIPFNCGSVWDDFSRGIQTKNFYHRHIFMNSGIDTCPEIIPSMRQSATTTSN